MTYKNIPAAKNRSPRAANPQSRTHADERAGTSPKLRAAGGKRRIPRAAKTRGISDSAVFSRTRLRIGAIYLRIKAQIGPPAFPCQPRCAEFPRPSALWRRSPLRRIAEHIAGGNVRHIPSFPIPGPRKKNPRNPADYQKLHGGRDWIRTSERQSRTDLQSAPFSPLDTLPSCKLRIEHTPRDFPHKLFFQNFYALPRRERLRNVGSARTRAPKTVFQRGA